MREIDLAELTKEQIEKLEDGWPIDIALSPSGEELDEKVEKETREIREAARITGEDLQMRFGPACGGNDWSVMYK